MVTCLNKIIGLRNDENATSGYPEGYNESDSGVFLMSFSELQINEEECDLEVILPKLDMSKKDALDATIEAFQAGILKENKNYGNFYKGFISSKDYRGNNPIKKTYVGHLYKSQGKIDTFLRVDKIGLLLNVTKDVDVLVYQNEELLTTITVPCIANSYVPHVLVSPLVLPFADIDGVYDYRFLYTLGAEEQYKGNNFSCATCSALSRTIRQKISYHAMAYGIEGDDLETIDGEGFWKDYGKSDMAAKGLVIEGSVGCDSKNLVCNMYSQDEPFAKVLSHAIKYNASKLFVQIILDDPELSRITTLHREALYGKRSHFQKEWMDRVNWLVDNIDLELSGCFVCEPAMQLRKI